MGSGGSREGREWMASSCCGRASLIYAWWWSLAVSLLGSETLWRRKMGTDQNQSGMKPRVWLATGRSAKLRADRHPPGETRRPAGQGSPLAHLTGPVLCRERWQRGCGSQWGTQSCQAPQLPQPELPALPSADCLQMTSDCVF